MKKAARLILGMSAILMIVSPAGAENEKGKDVKKMEKPADAFMARMDKDNDGAVTKEEYVEVQAEGFSLIDKDGDGRATKEEFMGGMDRDLSEKDRAELDAIRKECGEKMKAFWDVHAPGHPAAAPKKPQ